MTEFNSEDKKLLFSCAGRMSVHTPILPHPIIGDDKSGHRRKSSELGIEKGTLGSCGQAKKRKKEDKNFLSSWAGWVSIIVSIYPSNHREEVYIMAQKDVKNGLGRGVSPQSNPRRQKCLKSPRSLLPSKVKVMKDIHCRPRRPSRVPVGELGAEEGAQLYTYSSETSAREKVALGMELKPKEGEK